MTIARVRGSASILFIVFSILFVLFALGFLFFSIGVRTIAPVPPMGPPQPIQTGLVLEETQHVEVAVGFLVDALGKPIAGGHVRLYPYDDQFVGVESDDNGRFLLRIPAEGASGSAPLVDIRAPGYYRQILQLSSEPGRSYPLFRAGIFSGTVSVVPDKVGDPNPPVPGARLEIAGAEGWFDEVTADGGGNYRFYAPPGPLLVTVRSDTCGDQRIENLVSRRDVEVRHDVLLHRGCQVDLVVMSSAGAMAGAKTRVEVNALNEVVEGVSGQNGHSLHFGLTPGRGKYIVIASGFKEVLVDFLIPSDRILVRKPVFLDPAPPWTLEVVDAEGNPFPEARITILRDRQEIVSCLAEEKGKLQVLDPERTYTIKAVAEGFAAAQKRFEVDAAGSTTLEIPLLRGGRISGRLLDHRRQPIAGAQVLISRRDLSPEEKPVARLTTTGGDGEFRTSRHAPGSYRIQLSAPRVGRVSVDIVVIDGKDKTLGDVVFEPPGG